MASAFCSNADRPGLLGQSMLATDAIHAARNSRMVEVIGLTFLGVICGFFEMEAFGVADAGLVFAEEGTD